MSHKSSDASGGMGLVGVLTTVFITLKLCGLIDWSWWWVLSPIWGVFASVFLIVVVIGAIYLISNFWS